MELTVAGRRLFEYAEKIFLLAEEAKKRGLTTEELVAQEVPKRIEEITEADLRTTYDQMRSQMGGRTLDEVRVALAQFLMQQRQTEARQALVTELRAKATGIEVLLEPPRYTVVSADHEPVRGPASAPVEIVEFSDFQCPYCGRVNPTLDRLRQTFGDDIKIVFRDSRSGQGEAFRYERGILEFHRSAMNALGPWAGKFTGPCLWKPIAAARTDAPIAIRPCIIALPVN